MNDLLLNCVKRMVWADQRNGIEIVVLMHIWQTSSTREAEGSCGCTNTHRLLLVFDYGNVLICWNWLNALAISAYHHQVSVEIDFRLGPSVSRYYLS